MLTCSVECVSVCPNTHSRACLSIFIYGETSKQFRASVQTVYGETGKIKGNSLSWNQRQGNKIVYSKTCCWISSKLTPVDVSRSCASFCILNYYCKDSRRSAIAVSLPPTANLSLIAKILNHVSKFYLASKTNIVSR